jgi:hypothetical protein
MDSGPGTREPAQRIGFRVETLQAFGGRYRSRVSRARPNRSLRFVSGLAERTQTQSSVRTLWSLRQQMDVRFCRKQEPQAERHNCVNAGYLIRPIARSPERAQKSCAFLLTKTYMDASYSGTIPRSQASTLPGQCSCCRPVDIVIDEKGFLISYCRSEYSVLASFKMGMSGSCCLQLQVNGAGIPRLRRDRGQSETSLSTIGTRI